MPLSDADIADLANTTTAQFNRMRFTNIATTLQRYEFFTRLLKPGNAKSYKGGNTVEFRVLVRDNSASRMVGYHERDDVNIVDGFEVASIPWRHQTTNYSFERREILVNSGRSMIVRLMQARRIQGLISMALKCETQGWSKPASSSNKTDVFGVPYWVIKPTSGQQDFHSDSNGDPSGFTAGAGGLAVSDYGQWGNYGWDYATISKDDLFRGMRKGCHLTNWESPVNVPDFMRGRGQQYRFLTNIDVVTEAEEIGEGQNENLGRDLAPYAASDVYMYASQLTFRRFPIVYVPQLDSDTSDPVYGLDYSCFYPVFLAGDYLRESGVKPLYDRHNTFVNHIDLTWNIICFDRRRQMCFAKI